ERSPTRRRTSSPSSSVPKSNTRASPLLGLATVASTRRRVLFPEPFGPRRHTDSPGAIVRSSPRRAQRNPYLFPRPLTETAGLVSAGEIGSPGGFAWLETNGWNGASGVDSTVTRGGGQVSNPKPCLRLDDPVPLFPGPTTSGDQNEVVRRLLHR